MFKFTPRNSFQKLLWDKFIYSNGRLIHKEKFVETRLDLKWNTQHAYKVAGSIRRYGKNSASWNICIYVKGKPTTMPRAKCVWLWHGRDIPEGMYVRHLDGDTLNDRITNLYLSEKKNP